jgi:hypothetical protein
VPESVDNPYNIPENLLAQVRAMGNYSLTPKLDPKQSQGDMWKHFFIQALTQAPMGLGAGGAMGGPITGGTGPGKGFFGHYQYKGMPLEGSAENLAQMHGEIVPAANPSPLSSAQKVMTPSWAHNLNKTNSQLYNEAVIKQMFEKLKE